MFICKSLVRDPRNKIVDVDLIQPSWFTEATDAEGLKKISKYIDDRNYIEGVILLSYNNENIFTYRNWDDVNYWWMYITLAVQMVLDEGEGWLYMPDQPAKITFKECGNDLIKMYTEWNDKTYILPEKELLTTLLKGSIQFFEASPHLHSRSSSASHGRRRQSGRSDSVRSVWRRLSPLLRLLIFPPMRASASTSLRSRLRTKWSDSAFSNAPLVPTRIRSCLSATSTSSSMR